MRPLVAHPSGPLSGNARVPGDKSISHRALMLGALTVGEIQIEGLLEGEDVLRTAAAMRALGAEIERRQDGSWRVHGRGIGGLTDPEDVLDMGNSGTGARLLMGILASHPVTAVVTGDASLRGRPMGRVTDPLTAVGAEFLSAEGGRLPITVRGTGTALPVDQSLSVPSAQVKSALLFAALNAPGISNVIEPVPTRDHTERMLSYFGADISTAPTPDFGPEARTIRLTGQPELAGRPLRVPADPSSAAFPAVAACLLPGSEILLQGVGLNPLRSGLFQTLQAMGADISFEARRDEGGEPVADIRVRGSNLKGVEVPAARAPSMIDEYPVLAVAAARANGKTVMRGIGELRVKESDRLAAMADGLTACGVTVDTGEDYLVVEGTGSPAKGGAMVASDLDHRIAMSFLVMGLSTQESVQIDDAETIDTSFPGFAALMTSLGARIEKA